MGQYQLFTEGGYLLEEAISALQKCIRRGLEKEALYWAIEVNSKYPDYLWRRLVIISTEDVGLANPQLIATIAELQRCEVEQRKQSQTKEYDLCLLGFAILSLARSPKSRETDDATNEVLRQRRTGEYRPEIPDFALDQHTARGRAMGRDCFHYWQESAKLVNEAYPSRYVGCTVEDGDGYHDAQSKKAAFVPPPHGGSPQMKLDFGAVDPPADEDAEGL